MQGCQSFAFRRDSAFFSLSAFLKMIFRFFWTITNKQKMFSCTDTATIDCSKSFGKQSVTSWFAGMRFFRFRSKFESAVPPLGTQNLTPTAMQHVGVQRRLPGRGRGEGDHRTQAFAPPPFPLSSLYTHTHTLIFRAASCYDFAVVCHGQSLHASLTPKIIQSLTFRWNSVCLFFFQTFRFFRNDFRFYEKSPKKNVPISDIASIGRVVNGSSWLGLPMCALLPCPVKVCKCRIDLHSTPALEVWHPRPCSGTLRAAANMGRGGWWWSGGVGEERGLK